MPSIGFQLSPAPSITNDFIAVIYKTTAPNAELARILDDTDHSSPQSFLFPDLEPGTYIVRVHQSADGVTLGNIQHDWWEDAVTNQILFERKFYQVGGEGTYDPAEDTTLIADPYFLGKNITGVFQQGNRYLRQDKGEWTVNVDGELVFGLDSIGGAQIKNWVDTVWTVEITYPQTAGGTGMQQYGDILIITTNTTLDSTHWNKTLYCRGSANKLTITVPALASMPENKGFTLVHDGGSAINVLQQLQPGEIARFRGDDKNNIKLAKGDVVRCLKKTISGTANLYSEPVYGNWERAGEIVALREATDNAYSLFDPTTEYDLTVHLRLADYINSLPPTQIVSYTDFDTTTTIAGEAVYTNRGFFAVDGPNNKCRLPDLLNKGIRFLKNNGGADSTRVNNIPGGYQHWRVGEFSSAIPVPKGNSYTGNPNTLRFGNGANNPQNIDWSLTFNTGQETTGRNIGLLPFLLV